MRVLVDAEASVIAERRRRGSVGPGRRRRRGAGPHHPQRRAAAGQVARPAAAPGTSSGSRRRAAAATAPRRLSDVLGHLDDDVDPGDLLAGAHGHRVVRPRRERARAGQVLLLEDREEPPGAGRHVQAERPGARGERLQRDGRDPAARARRGPTRTPAPRRAPRSSPSR